MNLIAKDSLKNEFQRFGADKNLRLNGLRKLNVNLSSVIAWPME